MPKINQTAVSIIGYGAIGKAVHALLDTVLPDAQARIFDRPGGAMGQVSSVAIEEMNPVIALDADIIFFCSSNQHLMETLTSATTVRANAVIISVARSSTKDIETLSKCAAAKIATIVTDCGVEPGLADAFILDCANAFDGGIFANVACGGIVSPQPDNLLSYRSLFGTAYLPLSKRDAFEVRKGRVETVPRFSGLDRFETDDGDVLECFHDGMADHLRPPAARKKFETLTQKTLRWPGYVAASEALHKLGVLIEPQNCAKGKSPKAIFERMTEGAFKKNDLEASKTILTLKACGMKGAKPCRASRSITFNDFSQLNSMVVATALPPLFCADHLNRTNPRGIINPAVVLSENLDTFLKLAKACGAVASTSFEETPSGLKRLELQDKTQ